MKKSTKIIIAIPLLVGCIVGFGLISPEWFNKLVPPWMAKGILIFGVIAIVLGSFLGFDNSEDDKEENSKISKDKRSV